MPFIEAPSLHPFFFFNCFLFPKKNIYFDSNDFFDKLYIASN
jgi:hypothetical protein